MPESTCEGCHADAVAFMAGSTTELEQFEIEADAMDGLAECTDCHDLSAHMTSKLLNDACLECHEGEDYAAPGTIARVLATSTSQGSPSPDSVCGMKP